MKKIAFILAMIVIPLIHFSQSIAKGKNVLTLGLGFGQNYYRSSVFKTSEYSYRSSPTINLAFEHGVSEAIPQSIIGIGGLLSTRFGSQKYSDKNGHSWQNKWTDITTLVKGFYHHKFLVSDKWDVYAAVLTGIKYRSYSFTTNDNYYSNSNSFQSGVYPAAGIAVGGRIYVSKSFGFYAEAGAGVNVDYMQAGLAWQF